MKKAYVFCILEVLFCNIDTRLIHDCMYILTFSGRLSAFGYETLPRCTIFAGPPTLKNAPESLAGEYRWNGLSSLVSAAITVRLQRRRLCSN